MFKNYYLFAQLLQEIKPSVVGHQIVRVFTFRKDELAIELSNNYLLLIGISAHEPYLFLKEKKRITRPMFALFETIYGQTVTQIALLNFDKHLTMELSKFRLEALFFPPHNNVFLFSGKDLIDLFKEKKDYPAHLPPQVQKLDLRNPDSEILLKMIKNEGEEGLLYFLKNNFAALNKTLTNEILFRVNLAPESKLSALNDQQIENLIQVLLQIGEELRSGRAYLYFDQFNRVQKIALIPLHHLGPDVSTKTFTSVNQALGAFYYERRIHQEFEKLKSTCKSALQKRLTFLERSLQRLKQNADLGKRKAEAELKGNLLLTFKNQIPAGVREVELKNIFTQSEETVKIRLNPAKSVVANAQRYFNKFKNIKHDAQVLQIKMDTYQKEIAEIKQLLQQLEQITTLQRLKTFSRRLKEMRLLQEDSGAKREISGENLKYAFNRLILDGQWDVYIGKDGPTNDLLTFSFANKWDIWLHAQGVPGAHVIIRVPNRNQEPPAHVIEQAARIAAAHSKAAHSSTVPVIYTQARYVSKMRKAPPGTVKVQNEKVLFVSPMNLN